MSPMNIIFRFYVFFLIFGKILELAPLLWQSWINDWKHTIPNLSHCEKCNFKTASKHTIRSTPYQFISIHWILVAGSFKSQFSD